MRLVIDDLPASVVAFARHSGARGDIRIKLQDFVVREMEAGRVLHIEFAMNAKETRIIVCTVAK